MFLKPVVFLCVLAAAYCINAQPQSEEDYENTTILENDDYLVDGEIIMEALDEDESFEEVVEDYADFLRESGLMSEKEIRPVEDVIEENLKKDDATKASTTKDTGSDCTADLVSTNLDVSAIIAAKNALEVACSLSADPKTRCIYFISVYQQTYRTYDYACFYKSEDYYVNPKAKFVKFNLGTGNYFLFNQRRY